MQAPVAKQILFTKNILSHAIDEQGLFWKGELVRLFCNFLVWNLGKVLSYVTSLTSSCNWLHLRVGISRCLLDSLRKVKMRFGFMHVFVHTCVRGRNFRLKIRIYVCVGTTHMPGWLPLHAPCMVHSCA